MSNSDKVKDLAHDLLGYMSEMRRYFHRHPERGMQEVNTANRIRKELDTMGIQWCAVGETGTLGFIEGSKDGKTVMLRADIDALEIDELTEAPYMSTVHGLMHACGHDGHTAMLLGAAKILTTLGKDHIPGRVELLFQPGEETTIGAETMVANNIMDNVDCIFGEHLWADLPVGKVCLQSGLLMAAADEITIHVQGKGGHSSLPSQCVDPIVTASAIVMNLQTIVSREFNHNDSPVISVCIIKSGTRFNVIPDNAVLQGTVRHFDLKVGEKVENSIRRICEETAKAFGATAKLKYRRGVAPVINDASCTAIAVEAAKKLYGPDANVLIEENMGSEDFSVYARYCPAIFAFIGMRNPEKGIVYPHHSARFDMDENALEIGAAIYAQFALDYLEN